MQFFRLVFGMVSMLAAVGVLADSAPARCGFSGGLDDVPPETRPCTFSQRQGYVDVYFADGSAVSLAPVGDVPGNYKDGRGRPAYRSSGLGEEGTIFQLVDRTLFVYWQREKLRCEKAEISGAEGCTLSYGLLNFRISASNDSSLNRLRITSEGLSVAEVDVDTEIDGSAHTAELADLDANGWPELYVYVSSAGSGSYGSLVAYAVNKGKSMTPVYLPPMDKQASIGYQGHDEFAVVESRLVRRFPLYLPGDINAVPNGGMRQLQYALVAGEAGWQLVVDRVVEY